MDNDCLYDEQDILLRVANGHEQAFSILVKQFSAVVYTHALTYLKNAAIAEEVTQDVFMSIWRRREELPDVSNFKGYLHVVTRNRVISEFRKKIQPNKEWADDNIELQEPNPADSLETRQLSEILMKAINKLPPRRQQVFKMSRLEGKSYEEIAADLGISRSSVNQHIVEALVFLRTYLRNYAPLLLFLII